MLWEAWIAVWSYPNVSHPALAERKRADSVINGAEAGAACLAAAFAAASALVLP